jgi:hypothetical protein
MRNYARKNCRDHWEIRDQEADYVAGIVMPKFAVYNDKREKIALVNSIDEAIQAIARCDEKHPPKWMRIKPALYAKLTRYGCLRLELDQAGRWLAFRDDCPLCEDGNQEQARFPSLAEAKRVANAHLRDGFASSMSHDDDLSWSTNAIQ